MFWTLIGLAVVVVAGVAWLAYLAAILTWGDTQTNGVAYYGLEPDARSEFKRRLRRHAVFLSPLIRILGRMSSFRFETASFVHDGIAGPKGTCDAESFRHGVEYAPRRDDVFVATQMKCGTTWMQHVVYQVLHRGAGDLVGSGTALYAVSPWLEARKSVAVGAAPLLGVERPSRIVKTHLPASLCPFDAAARYIYVTRHPVSCFASTVDFVATNVGSFAPALDLIEPWFCSDAMWWGPWTTHVQGWAARAHEHDNVLLVRFEDMKADLPAVVRRVAAHVGVDPLSDEELAEVVRKCSFAYMREHAEAFEMHPPHLLQTEAELFVRGSANRHEDVPAEVRERVLTWCRERIAPDAPPLGELYADLAPDAVKE